MERYRPRPKSKYREILVEIDAMPVGQVRSWPMDGLSLQALKNAVCRDYGGDHDGRAIRTHIVGGTFYVVRLK